MSDVVAIISMDSKPDPFFENQVRNRIALSRMISFNDEPKLTEAINNARQEIAGDQTLAKAQLLPLQKLQGTQAYLVSFEGDETSGYSYTIHGIRTVDPSRSPWNWREPKKKKKGGFQFPEEQTQKLKKAVGEN